MNKRVFLIIFALVFGFPFSNAKASTSVVFTNFNRDFIEGTNGRCNTPNPGFISICGQVRQTAILSSGGVTETGRPVKNAAINIYLGSDTATRKTNGNITERYQQAVTNEDGVFNLGLQQGVGRDSKVYMAVSCGNRLADLYVIDTTENFVDFDISVPCSTDAGSPSEAPTDLVYASREGFLSCNKGDFADLASTVKDSTEVVVPLEDSDVDNTYSGIGEMLLGIIMKILGIFPPPSEDANIPLVGKYTQDTLFSLQDIPSSTYSVIGSVYNSLPSPKDPSYGSAQPPLTTCQEILCCFNSVSSDPVCGNKNSQICGNIGTGLMDPFQDRAMCSATGTDLNKPICTTGGTEVTLGQFIEQNNVYPTWFCQPSGSSEAKVTTGAENDSYLNNDETPFLKTIKSVFPKEDTEQFSIVKAVSVTSNNYDEDAIVPTSYMASPFSETEEYEEGYAVEADLLASMINSGKYYRLGVAETLCGCLTEECLSTADPINRPVNIALFPEGDNVEDSEYHPEIPAYGYISVNSESAITSGFSKFGVNFSNSSWYDDTVPSVLSFFQPPHTGDEDQVEVEFDSEGNPFTDENCTTPKEGNNNWFAAYSCNGDVRDNLNAGVSLRSPGAEVAFGVRKLMAAFDIPFNPAPVFGGGYFLDIAAVNESEPGVGKGEDMLLDNALNGAIAYADRLRQFVASPVLGVSDELEEPTFYVNMTPGGGDGTGPIEINCDINAPDISMPNLISKELFAGLADRWISPDNYAEECYNDTVRRAINNGINPAYFLFTWLMESGASNYPSSIQDFGVNLSDVVGYDAQAERSIRTLHSYYHNYCATNGNPPWRNKLFGHFACYVTGATDQSHPNYIRLKDKVEGYYNTFETILWPEIAPGCPLPSGPTDTSCP